jgi:type I restriction enzyme R subunit
MITTVTGRNGDKNSNIEESYLGKYLLKQGYSPTVYGKAIYELKQVADSFSDDLYLKTKRFMRCFAVKLKKEVGTIISLSI